MWRTDVPIPHTSPPWVRLCRLAQHSTSAIRRQRKRAQARDIQRLEDSAPPRRPCITTWRRRKKQKQSGTDHQQQPVESDSTQISPAATRLHVTRGCVDTLTDRRDRTGKGKTGPGEGVVNAFEGKGGHRGAGSHRQEIGASSSRYHTHNNRGHRAATSSYQQTPSERVDPVRGTSSYIHPPGRPPGPLVATPELARDTDRSSDYRTVKVTSFGASLEGGKDVIALPTSLPVDATQCPTPPQQLL
jgi:hypothetical protein